MLSKELATQLKRINVSVDTEKTKSRVKKIWKSLSRAQKNEVFDFTGVAKATLYRVSNTGIITLKLLLPIAYAADVDPYYLMGATEEAGSFTDEQMIRLLQERKYSKLVAAYKKEQTKQQRVKGRHASSGFDKAESEPVFAGEDTVAWEEAEPETGFTETAPGGEAVPASEPLTADEPFAQDERTSADQPSAKDAFSEAEHAELTEDEILCLIKAVLIRAKKGTAAAVEKAAKLKALLLS